MDSVIIMVGRENEGVRDIEIMPDIPAGELAEAVAGAFGWSGVYDIKVFGKILKQYQTLADVNAWDGAELTFILSNRPPKKKDILEPTGQYKVLKISSH